VRRPRGARGKRGRRLVERAQARDEDALAIDQPRRLVQARDVAALGWPARALERVADARRRRQVVRPRPRDLASNLHAHRRRLRPRRRGRHRRGLDQRRRHQHVASDAATRQHHAGAEPAEQLGAGRLVERWRQHALMQARQVAEQVAEGGAHVDAEQSA
jgi:hypothetical protein